MGFDVINVMFCLHPYKRNRLRNSADTNETHQRAVYDRCVEQVGFYQNILFANNDATTEMYFLVFFYETL